MAINNEDSRSQVIQRRWRSVLLTALLAFLGLFFVLPLVWEIATSLKPTEQTLKDPSNEGIGKRLSVMWVPQSEEKAKVIDTVKPVFDAKLDGKDVTAEQVSVLPMGRLSLSVVAPPEYAGKTFEAASSDVKPSPREGSVYVGQHGGHDVRVVALDTPKEGDFRFAVLSPTGEQGQQFSAPRENFTVLTHPDFRWDNYVKAFMHDSKDMPDGSKYIPFLEQTRNSVLLVILIVSGVVASNSLVAYAFARLRWPGRDVLFILTLATMMIPFPVTMVPLFALFKTLGWIGTFRPLWGPAWFGAAFNIFLLRQFFMGLPKELSEAAKLDGCNEWTIFYQIILPLAKPALAVVALFSFMGVWNDFLGPLIYLQDQHQFTLAVGLNSYKSQAGGVDINFLMAASTLVIAPIIVTYFFAQKLFMQGIAATGLKG